MALLVSCFSKPKKTLDAQMCNLLGTYMYVRHDLGSCEGFDEVASEQLFWFSEIFTSVCVCVCVHAHACVCACMLPGCGGLSYLVNKDEIYKKLMIKRLVSPLVF